MDQMPALIENIVHDTHIYVLEMPDVILGDPLCLLIRSLVNLTNRGGVIVPYDGYTMASISDLHSLYPGIQKYTMTLLVGAGFAYQDLQFYLGIQQHFDLICYHIDQGIGRR